MDTNRIRDARTKAGLNAKELATKAKISQSLLSRYERGERKPTVHQLIKIAAALGIPVTDIADPDQLLPDVPGAFAIQNDALVPVRGKVAAGAWLEYDAIRPFEDAIATVNVPPLPGIPAEATYGLLVEGTSINKIAAEGEILICLDVGLTGIEVQHGDLVVIERRRVQEGTREVSAKRLVRRQGRVEFWPESDDHRWQTPLVPAVDGDDEVRVIARVEWIYKPVRPRP